MHTAILLLALVVAGMPALHTQGASVHDAVRAKDLASVKRLVEANASLLAQKDTNGDTPLHVVASRGHAAMVAFLVQRGADLNARTISGKSAYNLAVEANQTAAVQTLARLGASSSPQQFPVLKGPYLGQTPPGAEPAVFARDIVSGLEEFSNHSSLSLSPDGTEMYWGGGVQLRGAPDESYLVFARMENGQFYVSFRLKEGDWQPPVSLGERLRGVCPQVSPDGKYLFYLGEGVVWVDTKTIEALWPGKTHAVR